MNRRSFFRFLGAGAATLALSEAIPFGRVWSFPSKIVVPERALVGSMLNIRIPMKYGIDFAWDDYEKCVLSERTKNEIRRTYLEPAERDIARQFDMQLRNHPASRAQTGAMRRILGLVPA